MFRARLCFFCFLHGRWHRVRLTWDIGLIMPFLVYLTIVMPFRLCFANEPVLFSPIYFVEFTIDMVSLKEIPLCPKQSRISES